MFDDELSLLFSNIVYTDSVYSQPANWSSVSVDGFTDANGFYEESNGFACKAYKNGNDIVIACRGTNSINDVPSDLLIALGLIPTTSLKYAENFYKAIVKEYCPQDANGNLTIDGVTYNTSNISFTGHSLGGAIAEMLGAEYGNNTVTFNAPGMETQITNLGFTYSSNITNYVIMNDYVGNYGEHTGTTYYIQPVPITSDPFRDTHCSILDYTETVFGSLISSSALSNFTPADAISLWYYDVNNTLNDLLPT